MVDFTWGYGTKKFSAIYFDHIIHFEDFGTATLKEHLLLSLSNLHYPILTVVPTIFWFFLCSGKYYLWSKSPPMPCSNSPLIQSLPTPWSCKQHHNPNKQKAQTYLNLQTLFFTFHSTPTQPPHQDAPFDEPRDLDRPIISMVPNLQPKQETPPLLKFRGFLSNQQRAIEHCPPRNRSQKNF